MSGHREILDFIDEYQPELRDVIDTLYQADLYQKRPRGMTLLVPYDQKTVDKLCDCAYSGDPALTQQAVDMLCSMLLIDCFKTPADFMHKKDDIPNSLRQKLEIESIKGTTIIFKCGAKIIPDKRFMDDSEEKNLAVWRITEGEIPLDLPKASLKYLNKKKSTPETENTVCRSSLRLNLTRTVEGQYITTMLNRSQYNRSPPKYVDVDSPSGVVNGTPYGQHVIPQYDPFFDNVMSFLSWIFRQEHYHELVVTRIIPMLSFDKTDFFILFEPYKTTGEYLIRDSIIKEWQRVQKPPNRTEVINIIESILTLKLVGGINPKLHPMVKSLIAHARETGALMYSNQQGALTSINEKRNMLLDSRISPARYVDAIKKSYVEIFKDNIIPENLKLFYGKPENKLAEDEFRFVVFQRFHALERAFDFDRREFETLLSLINTYTNRSTYRFILLVNPAQIGTPQEKIAQMKIFIKSSTYFHIALAGDTLKNYPHEYIVTKPTPTQSFGIFNIDEFSRRKYRPYLSQPQKVYRDEEEEFKNRLKSLKSDGKLEEYLKGL